MIQVFVRVFCHVTTNISCIHYICCFWILLHLYYHYHHQIIYTFKGPVCMIYGNLSEIEFNIH